MTKIIEFKNTNFGYDSFNSFSDFNMEIEEKDIVTLVGPSGSGKSTILKMLCHKLPNDSVYYKRKPIEEYSVDALKKEIVVIFDEPLRTMTVKDELAFYLKKLKYTKEEIEVKVEEFIKMFNLERLLTNSNITLKREEKYLLKILSYLIFDPKFIAIDNILGYLNKNDKKAIFDYIKKHEMTLLNVTTDLNESLLGNKLFVLENFVLILEGSVLSVLKTDTLLKRLGFKLPVAVDLSIELNHYDILNKIYTDKQKLVNALWK